MQALLLFVAWCVLLVLSWPLALLLLVLVPVIWLVSLPLGLIGIALRALNALVAALWLPPARLLGHRG
jgi:hypothetical protein